MCLLLWMMKCWQRWWVSALAVKTLVYLLAHLQNKMLSNLKQAPQAWGGGGWLVEQHLQNLGEALCSIRSTANNNTPNAVIHGEVQTGKSNWCRQIPTSNLHGTFWLLLRRGKQWCSSSTRWCSRESTAGLRAPHTSYPLEYQRIPTQQVSVTL